MYNPELIQAFHPFLWLNLERNSLKLAHLHLVSDWLILVFIKIHLIHPFLLFHNKRFYRPKSRFFSMFRFP